MRISDCGSDVCSSDLIEGHLAGLAALFNAPLTIGELKIDVAIAFGVNDEFEGSNAQRLAAALVAAEKSIRTRALWTKYTPRQQEDAGDRKRLEQGRTVSVRLEPVRRRLHTQTNTN